MKRLLALPSLLKGFWKAGGKGSSATTSRTAWHALKMQLLMGLPMVVLTGHTAKEKLEGLTFSVAATFLTAGMNSPWRQAGWSFALTFMPHFGSIARGIVHGYRGALESRTSLAVPFSHSTLAMDQAFATLQYSKSRMSEAYTYLGNEAAFFSARYMARG